MREQLCRALCDEITIREVPVGLAVSTAFRKSDGDAVIFYVVNHPTAHNLVRLEDDGQTISYLEAAGVDFDTQTRARALERLLDESAVVFDEDEGLLQTAYMQRAEVPKKALSFVALLLRLQDFLLLTQDHAESTFREDAAKMIRERIGDKATISESVVASRNLAEVTPDMVIRAPNRIPVAVFFGQSAPRVYDAIILQLAALYEAKEAVAVVALLEAESSISREMRQRAANRLAAVPIWKGDELAAIIQVERQIVGIEAALH
jgi:Domain of unknown function DUF1828